MKSSRPHSYPKHGARNISDVFAHGHATPISNLVASNAGLLTVMHDTSLTGPPRKTRSSSCWVGRPNPTAPRAEPHTYVVVVDAVIAGPVLLPNQYELRTKIADGIRLCSAFGQTPLRWFWLNVPQLGV